MSPWICMIHFHARGVWLGVYIGRGLRLFFYRLRDCEALIEREEQVNFTLFVVYVVNHNIHI